MNKFKNAFIASFAAALGIIASASLGMTASADDIPELDEPNTVTASVPLDGWNIADDGSITCCADDGSLLTGIQEINGQKYLFSDNGVLKTGWRTIDGKRYFFDHATGQPVFGDFEYAGRKYRITESDGKITGIDTDSIFDQFGAQYSNCIVNIDGSAYAVDESGAIAKDQANINGASYLVNDDGTVISGWQFVDGRYIYRYEDGSFPTGAVNIDGLTYFFSDNGEMLSGWHENEGHPAYFNDESGDMLTGFHQIGIDHYFFLNDGMYATGAYPVDGVYYTFNDKGVMSSGLIKVGGKTYYSKDDCIAAKGVTKVGDDYYFFEEDDGHARTWKWVKVGDKEYFSLTDGKLAKSTIMFINNKYYAFGKDALLLYGWQNIGGKTYYANERGALAQGWATIGGSKYYFDKNCVMQTGVVEIDGVKHRFAADGKYTPVKICIDAGHFAKFNHSPVNDAYWESDFTWKFHLMLKEELEKLGAQVITTRPNQEGDLGLIERGEYSKGCDFFISVHSNAGPSESADSPEAWCTISHVVDDLGQMLADAVADVMDTRQGGAICHKIGDDDLDWYSVLWGASSVGVPSILMEHSYHTNYRATVWLMNEDNLRRMAIAEAPIIYEYFLYKKK